MDISLKGSRAYGHKKRSDVHQPEVEKLTFGKDVRAGAGDGVVAANRDLDDAVITSPSARIAHGSYPVWVRSKAIPFCRQNTRLHQHPGSLRPASRAEHGFFDGIQSLLGRHDAATISGNQGVLRRGGPRWLAHCGPTRTRFQRQQPRLTARARAASDRASKE
jgi:hypothetical protein